MSTGAVWGGLKIAYAVELEPNAATTYRHNHPDTILIERDIRTVTADDMRGLNRAEPLIVFGGPPCQGFSTSNQRTRGVINSNNWLFLEYARLVEELSPDWVLFENVKGMAETEGGVFLESVIRRFKRLGLKVSYFVLNAAHYGVPQRRTRIFILGSRRGQELTIPKGDSSKLTSVSDAIDDLPELENGANYGDLPYRTTPRSHYAESMRGQLSSSGNHLVTRNAGYVVERYAYIPQGGNWEHIPQELMNNYANRSRCHTGIYYRLKQDEPSVVVGNYRKNMLIHPTQHRGLSVREAARLQSFPDWYRFKGSIGFQQQQVGNAVPPMLAKVIFDQVLAHSE